MGTNVSTTYITCPADGNKTLGIKLPFLVMILKNLKKYFTFEVMVLDDKNIRRRFRASNYQSTTRVKPFICTMAGIKFNSTCRISPGVHMAQTTSRHCECRFMPTVAFAEFTFPIGCTRKTSCLPSSNCSCPSRTKKIHSYTSC